MKRKKSSSLGFVLICTALFIAVLVAWSLMSGSGRVLARFLLQFLR